MKCRDFETPWDRIALKILVNEGPITDWIMDSTTNAQTLSENIYTHATIHIMRQLSRIAVSNQIAGQIMEMCCHPGNWCEGITEDVWQYEIRKTSTHQWRFSHMANIG